MDPPRTVRKRESEIEMSKDTTVRVTSLREGYAQKVEVRGHTLSADEPQEFGGTDTGPTPYELLSAALGSCTTITVQMYARRKNWPLEGISVDLDLRRIHAKDCEDCEQETGFVDVFEKRIKLEGPLSDEQRERLLEISGRCPVHRTLTGSVKVETSAV